VLRKFNNRHENETCIIIGNGRKLGATPRELLDKYVTIGTNKIFLCQTDPEGLHDDCKDLAGFVPDYYVCVDRFMMHDCVPALYNGWWPKREDGVFIPRKDDYGYSTGFPVKGSNQVMIGMGGTFAKDMTETLTIGGTVTYVCLEMAYAMGFTTVLLTGVDHHYGKYNEMPEQIVMIAEGEDDSHFHKRYFEHGHIYATATLTRTPWSYRVARQAYEADQRLLLNLTPDTMLIEIEKGSFKDWL
jgi:hypothetical protein